MFKKRVVSNFDLTPQTNQKTGKKKQTKKKHNCIGFNFQRSQKYFFVYVTAQFNEECV